MKINEQTLKSRVRGICEFRYFTDKALWYECDFDNYIFSIPVIDTINEQGGDPIFNATEKGILLMRWIRKEMEKELEGDLDESQI